MMMNQEKTYAKSLEERNELPIASGQEEYIKEVMSKEAKVAAIQKERQADEKEIKQIKQSNTWKHTRVFRRLQAFLDRKSTRLNSSHVAISYAVFCLKKKTKPEQNERT